MQRDARVQKATDAACALLISIHTEPRLVSAGERDVTRGGAKMGWLKGMKSKKERCLGILLSIPTAVEG